MFQGFTKIFATAVDAKHFFKGNQNDAGLNGVGIGGSLG